MKNLLWNILLIVIGIILILFPARTIDITIEVIGIILLLCGVVGLVLGIKGQGAYRVYTLSGTAVAIAAGIIFLVQPSFVRAFLPMLMGITILLSGVLNIDTAFSQKKAGAPKWPMSLVISIITVILGVLILMNLDYTADIMIILIGFIFVFNGTSMLIMKLLNKV